MTDVDDIRAQALEVAAGWSPPDQPESWRLTAALFTVIAAHDELLAALSILPPDRLPALLASAAIAFLVPRAGPGQLARYFPAPGGPQPPFDDDFGAAAAAFVSARLPDIIGVCGSHRYQMNEVARCTQIALGIAATRPRGPIGLIDLGTGAGLGLQLDRYRYVIDGTGTGPTAASVVLTCELVGAKQPGAKLPPPPSLPPIAARATHPLSVRPVGGASGDVRAVLVDVDLRVRPAPRLPAPSTPTRCPGRAAGPVSEPRRARRRGRRGTSQPRVVPVQVRNHPRGLLPEQVIPPLRPHHRIIRPRGQHPLAGGAGHQLPQ